MSCSDPICSSCAVCARRKCNVAPLGLELIKTGYSQIELRIAAKIIEEAAFISAYLRGDDLDAVKAKAVLEIAEVIKAHRQHANALNFGPLCDISV